MLRRFSASSASSALPALAVAAAALAATVAGAGTPAAAAVPPTPCPAPVVLGGLAFDPPSVVAGGTSQATLTTTNCTGQTQTVSQTWTGRFLSGSSTGIPAGCPAIDPLPRSVALAPHAQVRTTTGYLVFAGCTADRLRLTVTVSQGGVPLGSRTADLLIVQPTPGAAGTPLQTRR